MRVSSWNVNGIRAVERKGALAEFLQTYRPEVCFWQETKAQPEQLEFLAEKYADYHQWWHSAEKKGYSGVGVWVRKDWGEPAQVVNGLPMVADPEGRMIRCDVGDYSLLGGYFPNGGKSDAAWEGKLQFYGQFLQYVNELRKAGRQVIWCGDVNAAHEEVDLARPKENQKSIGFLPQERAWVSQCITEGWADVWRRREGDRVVYSWWHVMTRARERNVGWRIDYMFVDEGLLGQVVDMQYLTEQMGSDHCPVLLELARGGGGA